MSKKFESNLGGQIGLVDGNLHDVSVKRYFVRSVAIDFMVILAHARSAITFQNSFNWQRNFFNTSFECCDLKFLIHCVLRDY